MSVMCIKYYFHFHLSVPLLHTTSGYIKSNFFGFRWAKWVVFFSLAMQLNMLTDCNNSLSWDFAMCWWNSVVQSTKRFNSVLFYDVWKPHTAFIFLNTFLGFCLVHGIELVMNKWFYFSLVTFWLSFVETSFMFRVNIWSWHHIYRHILPKNGASVRSLKTGNDGFHGCVPLGWSGSESLIRDQLDHGRSNEPMNPCPEWIYRFIWSTTIRVISDHWSWYGSSQRNAPMCFIAIANGRFAVKRTCITVISTDLENKRRSQTIGKCKYV